MWEWIDAGRLADGEPLPSERELCQRLGVGRSAVRSALSMLRREGVIVEDAHDSRIRVVRRPQSVVETGTRGVSQVLNSAVVVLTPYLELNETHSQPGWVERIVQGAIFALRTRGFDVLAFHPESMAAGGLAKLLEAPPMGVLLPESVGIKTDQRPVLERLRSAGVPIVVYGGSPDLAGFDRVVSDHEFGGYQLTRWLIARGRRRVLMSWPANAAEHYWYPARRAGYERAMTEAGLEPSPTITLPVVPQDMTVTRESFEIESRRQVGFLMEQAIPTLRFDALLCHTDGAVPYAAEALRICGCRPGVDVLIAGYDNYALEAVERSFCPYLPAITIDKLNHDMGQSMVDLLLERRAGRLDDAPATRVIPPKLVELVPVEPSPPT